MNGQTGKSVEMLENFAKNFGRDRNEAPIMNVTVYYYLARAFEESGWTDKAIEQYEKFLSIWKDADKDVPDLIDAKKRLANRK